MEDLGGESPAFISSRGQSWLAALGRGTQGTGGGCHALTEDRGRGPAQCVHDAHEGRGGLWGAHRPSVRNVCCWAFPPPRPTRRPGICPLGNCNQTRYVSCLIQNYFILLPPGTPRPADPTRAFRASISRAARTRSSCWPGTLSPKDRVSSRQLIDKGYLLKVSSVITPADSAAGCSDIELPTREPDRSVSL
ncbi:hypothetical protein BD413DRAFT_207194 [Trametes elegans]|nr:hypothetical protein BD413DRAFT_207194 [Trametes elegans]